VVGLDKNDPLFVDYNQNFDGEPSAISNPELITMPWSHGHNNAVHNGIPRIGYQKGGVSARWVDENMADYFIEKVRKYIENADEKPFFMYYGLHQPHVPRTPHPRFVGASKMGPRGDAIVEADWCVGELINTLQKKGILENTIIIFSSDNGPVLNDGYKDQAVELLGNHKPTGALRGGKYSLFEAGARVPFIVYWKNNIKAGVSDAIVSQMDILPSVASLLKLKDLPKLDGINLKNAFLGKCKAGRKELVIEANQRLAIRYEKYSMIPPHNGPAKNNTNNELGNSAEFQLYNLSADISQQKNISSQNPDLLKKVRKHFDEITKGYYNKNTVDIPLK
jgi:arylsulfatase A-like enzyme